MTQTITIPIGEYKLLVRCKHIVEADFEENFTEDFIQKIKRIEEDIRAGKKISFKNRADMDKHLEAM